jgi:hypothetical protein
MGIDKLSKQLLTKYEGLHIKKICGNGFESESANHCAHFVNHVLDLDFGYDCKQHKGGSDAGANIRVHETFAKCPKVGKWADKGDSIKKCLAFITYTSSVKIGEKKMANRPKKHVGIYCDGNIWHYSNSKNKVVKQTPEQFAKHYSGSQFSVFYGTFPAGADPVEAPSP